MLNRMQHYIKNVRDYHVQCHPLYQVKSRLTSPIMVDIVRQYSYELIQNNKNKTMSYVICSSETSFAKLRSSL